MWMATFADMATLLMSFFVLLIAFAEMEKQDSVMASEGQTGKNLGVQDEIPSEEAPPVNEGEEEDDGLKKADADTDAGFEIVKANGGIMETLNKTNAALKPINSFMAVHSEGDWDVEIARFLEIEQDQGQEIQERLVHLKKQQSNALLLSTTNSELSSQIKASEDADNEALAEQRLRDQEITDMVKKHQRELNALIKKNNDDAARKTNEIIAKREEIKLQTMKVRKMVREGVQEDRREVAKSVTEFTNTIVKPDDED